MPPQAASGLSRAPILLGIRSAAYERVAAVREPRGDVATESRSLLFRESREDIHTPPPPATERRQVGCGRPSTGSGWWWGVAFDYSYRREFTIAPL